MSGLLVVVLLAGPELESTQPAPTHTASDAFAPVDIEPPPPHRPPAPSIAPVAAPEPIAAVPAIEPASPSDAPRPGNGRLMGGLVLIGAGIVTLATALEGADRKDLESNPPELTSTLTALGLISVGSGSALVVSGSRARVRFDAWRASTSVAMRKDGSGLIAGGAVLTLFAGPTLVITSIAMADPDGHDYGIIPALFGISAVGIAAGIGALSWGLVRRSRYVSWRASTVHARTIPVLAPLPHGVGVGLVGRF